MVRTMCFDIQTKCCVVRQSSFHTGKQLDKRSNRNEEMRIQCESCNICQLQAPTSSLKISRKLNSHASRSQDTLPSNGESAAETRVGSDIVQTDGLIHSKRHNTSVLDSASSVLLSPSLPSS